MKVVVAIDSFKGSVTSKEAGEAAKVGILMAFESAKVKVISIADGGEGTVDTLASNGGIVENVSVHGPLGDIIDTYYVISKKNTAIIEMAFAAGITLLRDREKNPYLTSTYGVGEMIEHAIKKGCRNFIIGIGGSATNDGGVGMLQALGFQFLDEFKKEIKRGGKELSRIKEINTKGAIKELSECNFSIACDVENPLCGKFGASAIYGPQKGATKEMVKVLDDALMTFAKETERVKGHDFSNLAGSGAAGGMGFAFVAYLNGALRPGVELILDEVKIDDMLVDVDFVVTGEGKIDRQTVMGKAPIGVSKRGKKAGAKVIAIAGCVTDDAYVCNEKGIDAFFSVADKAMTLEEAMEKETTIKNITKTVSQIFNVIKICKG